MSVKEFREACDLIDSATPDEMIPQKAIADIVFVVYDNKEARLAELCACGEGPPLRRLDNSEESHCTKKEFNAWLASHRKEYDRSRRDGPYRFLKI